MVASANYYYVFIIGSAYIFYPILSCSSIYLYFILKGNPPTPGNDRFVRGKQPFYYRIRAWNC